MLLGDDTVGLDAGRRVQHRTGSAALPAQTAPRLGRSEPVQLRRVRDRNGDVLLVPGATPRAVDRLDQADGADPLPHPGGVGNVLSFGEGLRPDLQAGHVVCLICELDAQAGRVGWRGSVQPDPHDLADHLHAIADVAAALREVRCVDDVARRDVLAAQWQGRTAGKHDRAGRDVAALEEVFERRDLLEGSGANGGEIPHPLLEFRHRSQQAERR